MNGGGIIAVVLLAIGLIAMFVAVERRDRRLKAAAPKAVSRSALVQSAYIVEDITTGAGGAICTVLLALTILLSLAIFVAAKTVFGEIEAGLLLIAGTLLFGMGIVLGRERSYRVYRMPRPAPPPVPEPPRDHSRLASLERLSKLER